LTEIGRRLRELHGIAEEWDALNGYPDEVLESVARKIARGQYEVGRPRWLVESVVHDLDRKRHDPDFDPMKGLGERLDEVAARVAEKERERHRGY
jgi:hypothetical protein